MRSLSRQTLETWFTSPTYMSATIVLRRIRFATALLAAISMVTWPALARGSCCCHNVELAKPAEDASVESVQPKCPACRAKDNASANLGTRVTSSASCSLSKTVSGHGESDDCRCKLRCCQDTLGNVAAPVHVETSLLLAAADAPFAFRPPTPDRSAASDAPSGGLSINAQDHCALLCRWLK